MARARPGTKPPKWASEPVEFGLGVGWEQTWFRVSRSASDLVSGFLGRPIIGRPAGSGPQATRPGPAGAFRSGSSPGRIGPGGPGRPSVAGQRRPSGCPETRAEQNPTAAILRVPGDPGRTRGWAASTAAFLWIGRPAPNTTRAEGGVGRPLR
jgi:hypothetical protein